MKKMLFNYVILLLIICGLCIVSCDSNSATEPEIEETSMTAYYPFNGNANDESDNNFDGAVQGATLTTDRFGNSDSAYEFDGQSSYIDCGDLNPETNNYSISFWVLPAILNTEGNEKTILGDAGGHKGLRFYQVDNQLKYDNQNSSTYNTLSGEISDSDWIHIVGTGNDGIYQLFINGNLIDSSSESSNSVNGTQNFEFGRCTQINSKYWSGKIDDIKIFNDVLTSNEITELYNE